MRGVFGAVNTMNTGGRLTRARASDKDENCGENCGENGAGDVRAQAPEQDRKP